MIGRLVVACVLVTAIASPVVAEPEAPREVRAAIVDGISLVPIPNAVVRIGERVVVADAAGIVTLGGGPGVTIAVTAPGYEPASQRVEPAAEPVLVLMFAPGVLDEVVEIHGHAPRRAGDGSYTLGRDEIRNLPGGRNDALAAVRSLPGIAVPPPFAAGRLVIRGGAPQDSLLTIDGVPVPFVYHAFDHSTILPVGMIGAISYSPGGFGVEEGRATSGMVGILTDDDTPDRPAATATLSLTDVSASGSTPLPFDLQLSGGLRRSTVDLLLPLLPSDRPVDFTTPPRYHDAQLRLDWAPSQRDRFALLAFTSFDRLGVVNVMPDDNDLPSDFATDVQFARAIASWKHETPRLRNRLVAAVGNGDFHATYDSIQYIDDTHRLALLRDDLSVDVLSDDQGPTVRVRAGVFGQLERHVLDAQTIVLPPEGLPPGQAFDDLPIETLAESYDTSYAAGYVAADVNPTDAISITAGARVDYFARIAAAVLQPRVEIARRDGAVTLRASAGRYARDHGQAQALDTSLSPELATQLTGGIEVALTDGLSAQATVYHTAREQLAVDDPAMGALGYASTGTGASRGVDLLLRWSRENLFAWLAYSYGKTSRRDRDGEATHATAFDQAHALTALASYQTGAWRFGARVSLATGLPYTDVVGATYSEELARFLPVLGTPYGTRYPDVVHVDLRVERTWHTSHVDIAAFIDLANVLRSERIHRYAYSDDFSEKKPITDLVPLPSIGVRGEF